MSSTAISKPQAKGFVAAWLGWAFDGLDGVIYTLVALPFIAHLMGQLTPTADTKGKAALIQAFFMFGWAAGGFVFGRIGDKWGRTKTLTVTILIYALFTGLSAFATEWWHVLIFRFIAALGIGGEWAAGSTLVAESLAVRHRAWASATLQSGYMVGMILASLTVATIPAMLIGSHLVAANDVHRWVFLIGVLPAFLTLWIRKAVPESAAWHDAKKAEPSPSVTLLFKRDMLPTTLKVLGMCSITLTTVWTFVYFNTQALRAHPEVKILDKIAIEALIGGATITYLLWNIAGNFAATFAAKICGVRPTFASFMGIALIASWIGFATPHSLPQTLLAINIVAFFGLGIFGIFPLYIPPLFPTMIRVTGAGFCYNIGRVVAGFGTIFGAAIAQNFGPTKPIAWISLLYIPGIILAFTMPVPSNSTDGITLGDIGTGEDR